MSVSFSTSNNITNWMVNLYWWLRRVRHYRQSTSIRYVGCWLIVKFCFSILYSSKIWSYEDDVNFRSNRDYVKKWVNIKWYLIINRLKSKEVLNCTSGGVRFNFYFIFLLNFIDLPLIVCNETWHRGAI